MTAQPWDDRTRLVAIDIETTGRRTPRLEDIRKAPKGLRQPGVVIEIGCIEILRNGTEWTKGRTWETRVNPDAPIHPDSIKVHNIRPNDLKTAPRFPQIVETMLEFMGEDLLIAHAYENEMDFLNYEFARCGRIGWGRSFSPAAASSAPRKCRTSISPARPVRSTPCPTGCGWTAATVFPTTARCWTPI